MGLFKILLLVCLLAQCVVSVDDFGADPQEFAEFEEFDEEDTIQTNPTVEDNDQEEAGKSNEFTEDKEEEGFVSDEENDDEATVDDDIDSEFEHFQDVEEFEGFEEKEEPGRPTIEPKITIAKVPLNFRQNWDSYYMEIFMVFGLLVYFMNFILGKNKNTKIANAWFQSHRQLLEDNFALVGDDGNLDRNENINLIKESENVFTLWCSGRTCCEGMLVELRLIKRQDLIAILAGMMRPTMDQIHITVRMNKDDMDSFVFAVAAKKTATQRVKDLADLSVYCPERKSGDKYNISSSFNVMSEINEASIAMLDSKVTAVLNKYPEYVDYIHFSDQFSGPKPTEDQSQALKLPDTEKLLMFGFNMPIKGMPLEEAMTRLKPVMTMVFYCIDKVKRYRLSKEGKSKADKNRQKVEEVFLKSTHQARTEAAAAKREEKRRQERERILAEEDPEKQRRWEIKEEKREAKRRAPKMKQLKVKAL